MSPGKPGLRCRPTPDQELLLCAALLDGRAASEAWNRWRSKVDIERLDGGSHRLLPLLYANLRRHGVDDPVVEKLKGVYRLAWYKNNLLAHRIADLLQELGEAGIEALILKGAALVSLYYEDPGLRPMADIDVMVRPEQAGKTAALLEAQGWRPKADFQAQRRSRHSVGFIGENGLELDLHWYLLRQCCYPGADLRLWENAVPVRVGGVEALAPGPADLLLHTLVHGSWWSAQPSIRWVADAVIVISGSGTAGSGAAASMAAGSRLDWAYLVEEARARQVVLTVREMLTYLLETFSAPVPEVVMAELRSEPVTRAERIVYAIETSPKPNPGYFLAMWSFYSRGRARQGASFFQRVAGFPGHLMNMWGLTRGRQVPGYILGKVRERHANLKAARDS